MLVDQSNYKKYFQFATKLRNIPRYSLVLAKCFGQMRGRKNIILIIIWDTPKYGALHVGRC